MTATRVKHNNSAPRPFWLEQIAALRFFDTGVKCQLRPSIDLVRNLRETAAHMGK
jgi:hypothetical protein